MYPNTSGINWIALSGTIIVCIQREGSSVPIFVVVVVDVLFFRFIFPVSFVSYAVRNEMNTKETHHTHKKKNRVNYKKTSISCCS